MSFARLRRDAIDGKEVQGVCFEELLKSQLTRVAEIDNREIFY